MLDLLCLIPLLSSVLTDCAVSKPLTVGYVEGEYVLIAPIETAQITELKVRRGDHFSAQQPLVWLERRDAEIAVAQTKAAVAQAQGQLADLREGKRPEEIAVMEVELDSAKTQDMEAQRALKRQADLLKSGTTTQASFDEALTNARLSKARVAELEAQLAVAKLPARVETIKAAEANVEQAQAALANAQWRLEKRVLNAPKAGAVVDIIRHPGEIAGPQAPVLSVLPEGATKIRLYLPQKLRATVTPGTKLSVQCDGCPDGLSATVNYVASEPEFTPPVIYSLENRQKLVYLLEAVPDTDASALQPGQIVDVQLWQNKP